MENPISKYIGRIVGKQLALKASPGKKPPLPENPDAVDPKTVIMDWFKSYQSLYRKELTDWLEAREQRRHPINPITYPLQQLYNDALIDSVLRRQMMNRILRVTNKSFLIKDKNGIVDADRSLLIQNKWFRRMVRQAVQSKFYGYSMIYINQWKPGNIISTIPIPREHVIPEQGLLLKSITDRDGLRYADFPNFLIYMQLEDDAVGLFESVAPLTILKRHSWASWDEFEQIFGMPMRIAKTMNQTKTHLDELEGWMQTMGSLNYAILPKTDEIEILPNNQTDSYNVFNQKRIAVNEEIAIAINGQTMTTFDGSSRSQSETHLKTQEEITSEDIQDVTDWFNTGFINVMRALGYDLPEGLYLDIVANTAIPIKDRSEVDLKISQMGYQFDPDYIEETYNVILNKDNPTKDPTPVGDTKQLGFFQ